MTIAGKNTPIVETGLANLTKNETRALVHFADGTDATMGDAARRESKAAATK